MRFKKSQDNLILNRILSMRLSLLNLSPYIVHKGPLPGSVPELRPTPFRAGDVAGIQAHLEEHGWATVAQACTPAELGRARDLLWDHIEGAECPQMTQPRPRGWRRGAPRSWQDGHGDGLMTSTAHCAAQWFVRCCPGVMDRTSRGGVCERGCGSGSGWAVCSATGSALSAADVGVANRLGSSALSIRTTGD